MSGASSASGLSRFLPQLCRNGEPLLLHARTMPQDDLLAHVGNLTPKAPVPTSPHVLDGPIAAIDITDDLVVTLRRDRAHAGMIQSFVAGLFESWGALKQRSGALERLVIDPEIDLAVWAPRAAGFADAAARLWTQISRDGQPDPLDGLTTPSIYGNKLRIARTIYATAVATLPDNSPVLDVMSGTGVVTRLLARRHLMTANDANPYAALLTRVQSVAFADEGESVASALLAKLSEPRTAHACALQRRYSAALAAEEHFLHGEFDEGSLERYVAFVRDAIPAAADEAKEAGDLVTARYANAYFGVGQAIEIDAIRVAIDAAAGVGDDSRDLCLAALVLAACICNPGPHFAQPRKVKSREMLRDIVDRRARSVGWEFEVALRRLASRETLRHPLGATTQSDWRVALDRFALATSSAGVRTVYLDPPYTKLQFSRYYHVLNVLLANDYPPISGTGRYPPRSYRFSSRFEYQPAMARREFQEIIGRCAEHGIGMMISYGERGFVPIDALIEMMSDRFAKIDVFSEQLRHHSQGRSLSDHGGGQVKEFVLVGRP